MSFNVNLPVTVIGSANGDCPTSAFAYSPVCVDVLSVSPLPASGLPGPNGADCMPVMARLTSVKFIIALLVQEVKRYVVTRQMAFYKCLIILIKIKKYGIIFMGFMALFRYFPTRKCTFCGLVLPCGDGSLALRCSQIELVSYRIEEEI
jgi:hypothetical protein